MKKQLWKILLFAVIFGGIADTAFAQQKKKKGPKNVALPSVQQKQKQRQKFSPQRQLLIQWLWCRRL